MGSVAHAPENAEQRRSTASRAGRSKPSKEIKDLKSQVRRVIEDVRNGTLNYPFGGGVQVGPEAFELIL